MKMDNEKMKLVVKKLESTMNKISDAMTIEDNEIGTDVDFYSDIREIRNKIDDAISANTKELI